MLNKRLNPILKVALAVALTLPVLLTITNGELQAASESTIVKPVALTPPPPEMESMQSLAPLTHIYKANGAVVPVGGLSVHVYTNTATYNQMKSLKVDYRLERWDGSTWIVYRSGTSTKSNTNVLKAHSDWTVISGYYYRVVSVHTAMDGSDTEKTTHISDTVLF
ncbi:hypothetical protein [Paenibacillus tundrae]|uniref:hypothetical protein n=1 Tax=Paenibacillus tundrae TaxID=528187 RepID=UPI0030CEA164